MGRDYNWLRFLVVSITPFMFVKSLAERFHVLGLSLPRTLLLLGSVLSLGLPEAIIRSLVRLNAMFTRSMQFMIGWRL